MNVKIKKEIFDFLLKYEKERFLFGSRLHGVNSEDSDYDYLIMLDNLFYDNYTTKAIFLPNIHSFQFDDLENNTQYVLMTERQFYHNLFSGDGNMLADIVLFDDYFKDESLFLCSGYKTIKGYLGVAKRDLKMHSNDSKKKFHAKRSLITAEALMNGKIIDREEYKYWFKAKEELNIEKLFNDEVRLRTKLNEMLDNQELDLYPKFIENNEAVRIMSDINNIREFKY